MRDLEQRLVDLPASKRALLARLLDREIGEASHPSGRTLLAYAEADPAAVTREALRQALADRLPDYMVPSTIVVLDSLPRTATGKIDRKALPHPQEPAPGEDLDAVAPRTEAEARLAALWADVLGVDYVGVHDNFFELGGDSLLSIRIIARAKEAGLRITPQQFFDSPTVADLAAGVAEVATPEGDAAAVVGPVPLTPIQHWFFDQVATDPHHWNQGAVLELRDPVDVPALEQALTAVVNHHDALRLEFVAGSSGWAQRNVPPVDGVVLDVRELATVPPSERPPVIAQVEAELHPGFDLARGPLLRATLFTFSPEEPSQLLLIVHHLLVDGVSWPILVEDLERAYEQLRAGEDTTLPSKTASFQQWAEALVNAAGQDEVRSERALWATPAHTERLPVDLTSPPAANTRGSAATLTVSLGPEETGALLRDVHQAYRTRVNDVLLTAFVLACGRWTGTPSLLVDLEGHGRHGLFEELDLSRTVGWLTSVYPVPLTLGSTTEPGASLKTVKEQLRAVPRHGLGHGLLRYVAGDPSVRQALEAPPRPEVCFNYLGQTKDAGSSALRWIRGANDSARSPSAVRPYLIEVDSVVDGDSFQARWTYSPHVHHRETIQSVAEGFISALGDLITHCQSGAGGVTPSDFPLAGLDTGELDRLASLLDDIDDTDQKP